MNPSEYVSAVADELRTNGWTQGDMHNAEGSCLLGAMITVALNNLDTVRHGSSYTDATAHIITKLGKEQYYNIPYYNDAPDRTINEVLGFLHDCQIELKETE